MLTATNAIEIDVTAGVIRLTAIGHDPTAAGDNFDVSFTGTQFTLTAHNGTEFHVGSQVVTTHTINVTAPVALVMQLSSRADHVTLTGNGTAPLSSLHVRLGKGLGHNSLIVDHVVVAGDAVVNGGSRADNVSFDHSTINGDFIARLGRREADVLEIDHSTVKGRFLVKTQQLVANTTTFEGIVRDVQTGKGSKIDLTSSTFSGNVTLYTGPAGIVNFNGSATAPNTPRRR